MYVTEILALLVTRAHLLKYTTGKAALIFIVSEGCFGRFRSACSFHGLIKNDLVWRVGRNARLIDRTRELSYWLDLETHQRREP